MNTLRTKSLRRRPLAAAAIAASVVLAGCGGGGGGNGFGFGSQGTPGVELVPGTQVPTSATTSVAGVIAFITSLIATTSETSEPIAIGDAVLSTSETDNATPLQ